MSFDFDRIIDRRGTHSAKWDSMEGYYGVSPDDGISMWVADMDFAAPPAVADALHRIADHGVFGYHGAQTDYFAAIQGFMKRRHGWDVDPAWITTTPGLVTGTANCVQAFTAPGEGVIVFTPVYHAFHRVIVANNRRVVESPLVEVNGRYAMDLDALAATLDGSEKMMIFCSPHNPGGRVWSRDEIRAAADFCVAHDLIFVSDEIHCDLVYPGTKHIVASIAAPEAKARTVMMVASTKTFNIAGSHTGNVIIEDAALRARFTAVQMAAGASPNAIGVEMATAAFNEGDAWLDALVAYLDGNRKIFDAGINAIPGLKSMALEATYLAWVDFTGTGMTQAEISDRVAKIAKIAANHGPTFGTGGEGRMRFNFATPRTRIEDAVRRLTDAFSDLQ
ncbi:MAG: cystathionine beta-lyase [Paracoccaceae bacterium]|jgi:cystathionine beta-lyase